VHTIPLQGKVVLLGDADVGKTSIIHQETRTPELAAYGSTITASGVVIRIPCGSSVVELNVFDHLNTSMTGLPF
jgi:GTPase SAR1 family protein